jgi:glycosyltransferase involved in cell wall biosynthesis
LPRFKQSLGDNFSYIGLVSGKSKCDFLRSLDVLVMPTYFEGLPMSLLECMSYGVVPVITPVGSIPEVVVDGNNGLFIKVKDTDSIVETIRKIDSDRNLLNRLSVNARNTIFSKFSTQQYISQLNRIYQEG